MSENDTTRRRALRLFASLPALLAAPGIASTAGLASEEGDILRNLRLDRRDQRGGQAHRPISGPLRYA